MVVAAIFRGDAAELRELMEAVGRNCTCETLSACLAHRALLDQRFLDGLVWMRWMRERLLREELAR